MEMSPGLPRWIREIAGHLPSVIPEKDENGLQAEEEGHGHDYHNSDDYDYRDEPRSEDGERLSQGDRVHSGFDATRFGAPSADTTVLAPSSTLSCTTGGPQTSGPTPPMVENVLVSGPWGL